MQDKKGEKRKFPRIKVELIVRYKVLDVQKQASDVKTKDISEGGICLVTFEPMKPGTMLATEIQFPHINKPIFSLGRIAWSSSSTLGPTAKGESRFDNGIEFVQMSKAEHQKVIALLESKLGGKDWKIGLATDLSE